ncbi:MAG: TSUP family transporter [Candidatus Cloacimonetes bacterium]|nr:TSUP family transporter [Candidatus Cloacimonadota bacterium]
MVELIILIVIGLFAGVFSGVLGIGGGVIIIPCLVYFMKMSQHSAQGTTLALMLPPITLMSVYVYWKEGHVDWKITLFVCIGFFVGSFFGGKIAVALSSLVLKRVFAIFLIGLAVNMLFSKK